MIFLSEFLSQLFFAVASTGRSTLELSLQSLCLLCVMCEVGFKSGSALPVQDQLLVLGQDDLLKLLEMLMYEGVLTMLGSWGLRYRHDRGLETCGEEIETWQLEREASWCLER